MRRAAKTDENQPEIVTALRAAGCSVQVLSVVGQGCPDLLVSRAGSNYLLEVKMPKTGRLTSDQLVWHACWRGHVAVVHTVEEALAAVGLVQSEAA